MSTSAALIAQMQVAPTHTEIVSLLLGTGLMAIGVLVHFVLKLAELEDKGQHYSPLAYLRIHPWRAASMVLCAWLLLYICHAMGELTRVAAVLIGFSCQAAADTLRARANARLSK